MDLTLAAVALAVLVGMALGLLTYRRRWLGELATTTTAAFLTIPSIALLGILIGPFGLGLTNVLFALVLYALLPITRNTIVGLRGVDPAVVDAARGMGLGRARVLWRVRLPLAWPVVLSGIRVSTQITIGIAAIGAYVKGPGLGNEIFDGLGRFGAVNSLNQVLTGTLGIMLLALLFDLAFVVVGKLTTWRRPRPLGEVEPERSNGTAGETIELENLRKHYPGQAAPAVEDLTMRIPAGEIVVLTGPSGCGKTTTMRMINRLVEPTSGVVTVGGTDVAALDLDEHRRHTGYVIQQVGLFPHLRVAANIGVVPRVLGWTRRRIAGRVRELLDVVGLTRDHGDRYPHELSGGQRQRVGVARAMAADPPVMLMDEPFGSTDPITRARLQDEFLRLQREVRKTIVFVTHDFDEALKLGDRIAVLRPRSVLAQYDTPQAILAAPADDYVASFAGSKRNLKRLALIPVADLDLGPAAGGLPSIPREATLRDALDTMVRTGSTSVSVDGRTLDVPRLLAALQPTVETPPAVAETVRAKASTSTRPRRRRLGLLVRPVLLAVALLALFLIVRAYPLDSIEQRYLNAGEIFAELGAHLRLTLISTVCTIAIALPLGVLLTRAGARWARPIGLGLGNLGQAIPSIGLVVLLALWVGTGTATAVAALVVYATLPVLRNTMVGLDGVDPTLVDAARGMGMTKTAILWRIELPLAVPVILAGIRTALVLTVASATLATFIDGGGLGGGLVAGIGLYRPILSLTFGIVVAALALFADWLGLVAEEVLHPRGL
ncbi:osmoprotectant transport system ATP-binding protein [Amycolatopsis pretoriensis]|uniref:ABC-type quaternary amine transporter n=1 Tax=Amycolatopsis pretoriensis TaxID=218821 RepID=A0A1H5QCQ9_9PSEU|nr:ABC transporter permease subunit [Amycolatopsis pretoriensis]SEF23892.1 osmoprotectant transport system ATP-binding protein [Amycolatopsis pretoriensis]